MCWYSSKCAAPPREAEAGARLAVREMHGFWNWLVSEADLHARKPTPVCMAEGSRVILRAGEKMQKKWNLAPDHKSVFRMDRKTNRDLFVTEDGREFDLNRLPAGLLLDVMFVPTAAESTVSVDALIATAWPEHWKAARERPNPFALPEINARRKLQLDV